MNIIIRIYPTFGGWAIEYEIDRGTSVAGGY